MQIAEIDATNEETPQVVKTYLWDPSEPVATRILHMTAWNNGVEVESLYYTHDLQKNVTALFGQAAGRRAQYEHDPYGNPINTTGDAAGQNPYRYSSEYHDEDLGLIYYNYRHYNPTDGRWINRDPIAEQGGINLYGFVGNTPLVSIDIIGNKVKRNSNTREQKKETVDIKFHYPDVAKIEPEYTNYIKDKEYSHADHWRHFITCECLKKISPPKYYIKCIIDYDAKIVIARGEEDANNGLEQYGRERSLARIYGHEQKHVLSAIYRLQRLISRIERDQKYDYSSISDFRKCCKKAKSIEDKYQKEIKTIFENMGGNRDHRTSPGFPTPESPEKNVGYTPINPKASHVPK